jgi:voltage-gated potassium channel
MRRTIYQIVEGIYLPWRLGTVFSATMALLIIINVTAVVLGTEPAIYNGREAWFAALEIFSVAVFSVEYLIRVWVAPEGFGKSKLSAAKLRWRYIRSPEALIDLAAILPFFLQFLVPGLDLRILRALRLLRLLKLVRYSRALALLGAVFVNQRRELAASFLVMGVLLLFTSAGMYAIERSVQPDAFSSIPRAMWWAMATLTTVGYGAGHWHVCFACGHFGVGI